MGSTFVIQYFSRLKSIRLRHLLPNKMTETAFCAILPCTISEILRFISGMEQTIFWFLHHAGARLCYSFSPFLAQNSSLTLTIFRASHFLYHIDTNRLIGSNHSGMLVIKHWLTHLATVRHWFLKRSNLAYCNVRYGGTRLYIRHTIQRAWCQVQEHSTIKHLAVHECTWNVHGTLKTNWLMQPFRSQL